MSSDLDAVGRQQRVQWTTGLLLELEDHFNQAIAALVCEQIAEVGGHLLCFRVLVLVASRRTIALRVNVHAEEDWSDCKARQ